MNKVYPSLPTGSVVCPICAKSGNHVEMERDDLDVNYLEEQPPEQGSRLQSYRCPDCEYATVFRVK